MEKLTHTNYLRVIKRRTSFITVVTLVVLLLSLIFTLIQPFKYQSEVKILIIQRSALGLDAYSASKSAERIGHNLAQIVYSSDFFSKVLNAGFGIDRTYFPSDEEKRRREWQRTVAAEVPGGTTILNIQVFHTDREQATRIAQSIAHVLTQEAQAYVGVGDVDLRVVDAPLTSNMPVKPNILLNTLLGLIFGLLLAIAIVVVRYSEETEVREVFQSPVQKPDRRRSQFRQKNKKIAMAIPDPVLEMPSVIPGEDIIFDEEIGESSEVVPAPKESVAPIEHGGRIEQGGRDVLPEPAVPEIEPPAEETSSYSTMPAFSDEGEIKTFHHPKQ